ncbi:MAG: hypothetical protein D6E12_13325 [Desulfovibrio sp.]|nr:MAG: hypothetical protein D6E12_13325 [Desulfovibrio sp.]
MENTVYSRYQLIVVYTTWLWILWNILVFSFLGVRDRTMDQGLFPEGYFESVARAAPQEPLPPLEQ